MVGHRELDEKFRHKRVVLGVSLNLRSCVNLKHVSKVLSDEEKFKIKEVENILREASER
jgi:hypothetical protein